MLFTSKIRFATVHFEIEVELFSGDGTTLFPPTSESEKSVTAANFDLTQPRIPFDMEKKICQDKCVPVTLAAAAKKKSKRNRSGSWNNRKWLKYEVNLFPVTCAIASWNGILGESSSDSQKKKPNFLHL